MRGQGGEPDLLARSLAWGFAWAPGPEPTKPKKTKKLKKNNKNDQANKTKIETKKKHCFDTLWQGSLGRGLA